MTRSASDPAGYPDPDLTPAPGAGHSWTSPDRDPRSPAALRRRRGPDLRLVPVALVTWVVTVVTVVSRSWWPVVVVAAVSVVAGVLPGVRRRVLRTRRRRTGTVVGRATGLSALVASAWSARAAWLVDRADRHPWSTGEQRTVRDVLDLAGAPKELAGGSVLAPVDVPGLGRVPLFLSPETTGPGLSDLLTRQPGTGLLVTATVRDSDRPGTVPVTLSARQVPETVADPDGVAAVTAHLRDSLRTAASHLPAGAADLVPGMVVGDVGGQDPASRTAFLATGLSHLTAVSGANVSLIVGGLLVLLGALGAPKPVQVGAAALGLGGFVLLVGGEPSVLRAAVTGLVGLVAVLSARRTHGFAACSAAVLVLLAVDPGLAVEYAFILSVVATVGIVALAPLVSRRLLQYLADARARRGRPSPVGWQAMACRLAGVSLAADVVTAPVIAHMTGVVSPTAVVANLLAGPAVPVVTVVGTLGALVAGAWTPAGTVVLWGCAPCAVWITGVAGTLSRLPVLYTTAGWWAALAVAPVGAAVVALVVSARWRARAAGVLAVAAVAVVAGSVAGVVESGPYPGAEPAGRFGAAFRRDWAEDLGSPDDGYGRVPGWTVGVRPGATDTDPPDLLVPDGVTDSEVGADTAPPVVVTVADDRAVLAHERSGVSPPQLYVVTACGTSRGLPTRTPAGVPVAYPCRDGTVLVAPDGLHASGR